MRESHDNRSAPTKAPEAFTEQAQLERGWWTPGAIKGALIGLGITAFDAAWILLIGVELRLGDWDMTLPVFGVFAANLTMLGYIAGRLYDTRQDQRQKAQLIETQYRALQRSQDDLLEAERRALRNAHLATLGQLAAGVAHEVRNPLAVIRSSASMLREDLEREDSREDSREAASFIVEEVDMLDALVRDLLSYARPLHPNPRQLALRELQAQLLERAPRLQKLSTLSDPARRLEVDVELLGQLLANLQENASHFAQTIEAELELDEQDQIELRLRDDGPGVDPELAEQIFDPFFTTRAEGTGLGLAMARRIAEDLGGSLTLRQGQGLGHDGQGACFVLRLPHNPQDEALRV